MNTQKITGTITDIAKVALTVAGVAANNPALELAAFAPEYIYKFLDTRGILNRSIDAVRKKQLDKVILSTVEKTNRCLTIGNQRELVSSIKDKLKFELSGFTDNEKTLDMVRNKLKTIVEDEEIWEEKYFSKSDICKITNTFYNIFLTEILEYEELRELIQIASIEKIITELQYYGTEISQIKDRLKELEEKGNPSKHNFIITINADTAPTEYFVGREEDIKNLREYVSNKQKLVLVSGMGGIGKTHLCRYVFRKYVDCHNRHEPIDIDHIGYFDYTTSMDTTLVNNLNFNKTDQKEKDIETAWQILKNISAEKRLLIFIDNITNTPFEDESLKKLYGITGAIILTSRITSIGRFKTYKVDEMQLRQCIELFEQIYGSVPQEDYSKLEYILNILAARHTKTVELLAHMANNKAWSIADLSTRLKGNHFNLSYISDGQKTTIQKEYEKLFNLAGLSESEVNVLEGFSIFPPLPLPADICNLWLDGDAELTEDDEVFNTLYQKGWLQRSGKLFSMHSIIAETVLTKQQPKVEDHIKLVDACISSITLELAEVFTKVIAFIPFAEEIYTKLYSDNADVHALLAHKIGYIYCFIGEYVKALEWCMRALDIYERVLGKEHPDTAATYNNIAVVYQEQGEYSKAMKWNKKALDIREKALGKEHPDTATTYDNIATVYSAQGEYSKAQEWCMKALDIREKVFGIEHPDTSTTYNNIALVYLAQGEHAKALEWCMKASDIREKILGKEHPSTATTYNNIAGVYDNQGEYTKALDWYKKALDIREKVLGTEHPDTATTYNNIASVYKTQGEYTKALDWYKKALGICEKVLGKEHPDTATTYSNIAGVYQGQEEYAKALDWCMKALDIRENVLGKEHPDTATTYNNIAGVYKAKGEYAKALDWYKKALTIYEKAMGKEHPFTATTYNNIAGVYQDQRKYTKALDWNRKASDICEKVLGKGHPDTATTYNNIASVYKDQGEYAKALEWYKKALNIREKVLGKEHPSTTTTFNNIALVYQAKGEYTKALNWYKRALNISEKILRKEHPSTAATYNNIAGVYKAKGEYAEALEWNKKALDIREKVLGTEHPDTATTYNNIAGVYKVQGEYAKALELYVKAFQVLIKSVGKNHPNTHTVFNNMYATYIESSKNEEDFEEWFRHNQ